MRFASFCYLLVALTATTALAQTHPKKKAIHEDVIPGSEKSKPAPLDTKVYFYVEQMPLLNGQNAYLASSAAITHSLVVPTDAPAGRVYVQFVVTKEGTVSQPRVIKGLRADLDSAVVAATRQLPRFTPGKQGNHVVAVSIPVTVTFPVVQRP